MHHVPACRGGGESKSGVAVDSSSGFPFGGIHGRGSTRPRRQRSFPSTPGDDPFRGRFPGPPGYLRPSAARSRSVSTEADWLRKQEVIRYKLKVTKAGAPGADGESASFRFEGACCGSTRVFGFVDVNMLTRRRFIHYAALSTHALTREHARTHTDAK